MVKNNINEALAVLISSTRSKKRPVSLMVVSDWLDIAVDKLGGYGQVADRIGLSKKMLRQFSLVKRLDPKVQCLFSQRSLDSIDAVVHLLALAKKEQILISNMLVNQQIDTKDLRAIVQIRKNNSKKSIETIADEIIQSKTKKHYIVEFILREGDNSNNLIDRFGKYIKASEIIRIEIDGSFGRLVLTNNGKKELYRAAKTLNTRFQQVVPAILMR